MQEVRLFPVRHRQPLEEAPAQPRVRSSSRLGASRHVRSRNHALPIDRAAGRGDCDAGHEALPRVLRRFRRRRGAEVVQELIDRQVGVAVSNGNLFYELPAVLADLFRGPRVEALRPAGLEHVFHFTSMFDATQRGKEASTRRVQLDSHRVLLRKSAVAAPEVELQPMGPRLEMTLRRVRLPNEELWKRACKRPKAAKVDFCEFRFFSFFSLFSFSSTCK